MAKAIWNGVVLAESADTEIVEGKHYFPPNSINKSYFTESNHSTICPWKGKANYFNIEVDGDVNENGAFYYATPKPAAENIKAYVAFWRGVEVTD